MGMVRVDVGTVIVGGGPVASLMVLIPRQSPSSKSWEPLPIRIGAAEASLIGMSVENPPHARPMTHELLKDVIARLGAHVTSVAITSVSGTTFYAQINLLSQKGETIKFDARPSDAVALAVQTKAPIYVSESVMDTAGCPDFAAIAREEAEADEKAFHDFVESLSPEDFAKGTTSN